MKIEPGYVHIARGSAVPTLRAFLWYLLFYIAAAVIGSRAQTSAGVVLAVATTVVIAAKILVAKSRIYVFYPDKVLVKSGILSLREDTVFLSKVLAVRYRQTFAGRIFGYGDVLIDQLGDNDFFCRRISHPRKLAEAMMPYVTRPSAPIF